MPIAALFALLLSAEPAKFETLTVVQRPYAPFISPMGEPFHSQSATDDPLARWFYQADRNRDGQLTADEMRANRLNAGNYAMAMTCSAGSGGSLAQNDQAAWINALKSTMGVAGDTSTCGRIEALGNSRYRITVQWDDQRAGGSSTRQVATEVRI